jgi:mannose-6-phosphate isomerase-like protein (cupin superfamily)
VPQRLHLLFYSNGLKISNKIKGQGILPMDSAALEQVRVIDSATGCPDLPIVIGAGHAKAVVWPGSGAHHRSIHVISLQTGATTTALRHPSDCVYYVLSGAGSICDLASGESKPLGEGAMVHIDAGDTYQLSADAEPFSVLGGPCPADPQFYLHLVEG